MAPHTSFLSEFPQPSYEEWRALSDKLIRRDGGSLDTETCEGIRIAALYAKAEGHPALVTSGQARAWRVMQRADHPDPLRANAAALADLKNGATGLVLVTNDAPAARGFGLPIGPGVLDRLLDGVSLDLTSLRVETGPASVALAVTLLDLATARGLPPDMINCDFGIDPVGWAVWANQTRIDIGALDFAANTQKRAAGCRAFLADGRPYHEAGAGEAQELACVLATGLFYLRALADRGIDPDPARRGISFLLAADAEEFLSLAKFRAMRRLWARIEDACGLQPRPIRLHAETAWRMMTSRDPHTNILRGTIAAFAAGAGGADSICVLPFDIVSALPDEFSRRIARNTQIILQQEANLCRVVDPAAGAGGFEALTDALCRKAWTLFQDIESAGGMPAALKTGRLQSDIGTVRAKRDHDICAGRTRIVGANAFPNPAEPRLPERAAGVSRPASGFTFARDEAAAIPGAGQP